ncbi:glycosyltransferase [Marinobacter sp.]|uniref:glycosyltransferase family 2 protein n=1 Tax=Marinobacter sp. TaxID=50741 RepID=UPI00199CF5C1|nr:glycosyltransferase [Marinobacter sp.]MBD3656210.1 glycosyltransferase family 2 protein [Marinobacter sp.]
MKVSVVLLSYNRPEEIFRNVQELYHSLDRNVEIIVVDNNSLTPVFDIISPKFPEVKVIRLADNLGVAGRNYGVQKAKGEFVITLDDDVFGFKMEDANVIVSKFESNPKLSAINFKIVDDVTKESVNWIHHRDVNEWVNITFNTYEISEGACAFRRSDFIAVGGYPAYFFISHEGPDLALRLLNAGFSVIYFPKVEVRHAHSQVARVSWRRYYFDTRNLIWLVVRNMPAGLLIKTLIVGLGAQFIYSVRDGYVLYWIIAIRDAILKIKDVLSDRNPLKKEAALKYKKMHSYNVGYLKLLKIRIFGKKGIRL